jgi:hypothetical protein
VTSASHRLAFAQRVPVGSPPLAVRAKGMKDAELLVTSLAIRTKQLLICVEDWSASSVSTKNNWGGLCSHNPSHVVDAQFTGVREEGPKNGS